MTPSRIELMRKRRRLGERKGVSESIILVNLFWCLFWSWTYKIDTFWDRQATKSPQFFGWLKTASSNQISIDWFVVRSNPPFGDKRLVTVLPPLSRQHMIWWSWQREVLFVSMFCDLVCYKCQCFTSLLCISALFPLRLFACIRSRDWLLLPPISMTHHGANYRARLKGGPQVAWILQASSGWSGKQEQEQSSINLRTAI